MRLDDLDYDLRENRIAQEPLPERDASRLLVLERSSGAVRHHRFGDLPELLDPGDLVVRNVSRVIPARLLGRRASGGRVEFLLVDPLGPDRWRALARPAARLADGERVTLESGFVVEVGVDHDDGPGFVRVHAVGLAAEVERSGRSPLPPYIRREASARDRDRYQTVFARDPGSVAAPTAGLHFTPELFARLSRTGIATADLVLHIGPGTFLPVRSEDLEHHRMHAERFVLSETTVAAVTQARSRGSRVLAIGTSSARVLETWAARGEPSALAGETDIFLRPGHEFRAISALLTNFHQPRSTLIALVAAFAGLEAVRAAYREALDSGYRFLSYGDAMLIL